MNSRNIAIIVIGLGLVIALLILFSKGRSQQFDWRETYEEESKQPYGTYIIHNLLQEYFPKEDFHTLTDSIYFEEVPNGKVGNYVFIGAGILYDSLDMEDLFNFVDEGNNAFFSSLTIPYSMMEQLYSEDCYYYWGDYEAYSDTMMELTLYEEHLNEEIFTFKSLKKNQTQKYNWRYIPSYHLCDDIGMEVLGGTVDSTFNFIRLPYGNGHFYFHTTPLAFTNLHLLEEELLVYSEKVFSYLEPGPIYWDDYSRTSEFVARQQNGSDPWSKRLSANSPLKYILSQPPLAWAWYLLLVLGLLYLIFRGKRKQRVIPILEKNKNTSLEFLSTIGRLYFLRNNHKDLAHQKMRLFLAFVRERYHINTKDLDGTFVKRLAAISEVSEERIDQIVLLSNNMSGGSFVSDATLIDFHKKIDYFYKNCK
jgi:hypothetical protein